MERTLGKTTYRLIINSDNPQEYNSHGVIIVQLIMKIIYLMVMDI